MNAFKDEDRPERPPQPKSRDPGNTPGKSTESAIERRLAGAFGSHRSKNDMPGYSGGDRDAEWRKRAKWVARIAGSVWGKSAAGSPPIIELGEFVHIVMIDLWIRIERGGVESEHGCCVRIAERRMADLIRKQKTVAARFRRATIPLDQQAVALIIADVDLETTDDPEAINHRHDRHAQLDETDRKILRLRIGKGMTFSQIADEVGLAQSTVKARFDKALRFLKE